MRTHDPDPWVPPGTSGAALSREEERLRPLYSRVLGLRHVNPGGLLCFAFFEGTVVLAMLLALAELVSWWAIIVLPLSVALMVKVNDEVAAASVRSAARVPQTERERFRRELSPAIGRAAVPLFSRAAVPMGGRTSIPVFVGSATVGSATGARGALGAAAVTGTAVVPYRRDATPSGGGAVANGPRELPAGRQSCGFLRIGTGAQRALPAGPSSNQVAPPGENAEPLGEDAEPGGEAPPVDRRRWAKPTHRSASRWPAAAVDPVDSPQQRTRQTAQRRYE